MYLVEKRVLGYLCEYQSQVTERLTFGNSDWTGDRESSGFTAAVLEKLGPLHRERPVRPDSEWTQLM